MDNQRRRNVDGGPPLQPRQDQEPGQLEPPRTDRGMDFLSLLGFCFLTFNSAMAICRSVDYQSIALVIFSYIDIVMLFVCLRWYEQATPASPGRNWLKVAVWMLTTLLTIAFSYKVVEIMPFPVAVLVWGMASATVLGGFYAFFLHRESAEGSTTSGPQNFDESV